MMKERVAKVLDIVIQAAELGEYDCNVIGMAAEIIAEEDLEMDKAPRGRRAVDGTWFRDGQNQNVQVKAWSEARIKRYRYGTFLTLREDALPDVLVCLLVYSSKKDYRTIYNDSPLKVGQVEKNRPIRVIRFDDMISREEIQSILEELGVDNLRTSARVISTPVGDGSKKSCSVCGTVFPIEEFSYGNRTNNSYCKSCCKGNGAAYARGGPEAARQFRDRERAKWKH